MGRHSANLDRITGVAKFTREFLFLFQREHSRLTFFIILFHIYTKILKKIKSAFFGLIIGLNKGDF